MAVLLTFKYVSFSLLDFHDSNNRNKANSLLMRFHASQHPFASSMVRFPLGKEFHAVATVAL